jgi:hypothetical protein
VTGFEDLPKRLQEYLRRSKPSSASDTHDEERTEDDDRDDPDEAGGQNDPDERSDSEGEDGSDDGRHSQSSEHTEERIGEWFRCPNCESEAVSVSSQPDGVGYIETTIWCTDCGCEGQYTTGRSAKGIWGLGRRS